jgi:hypothetical protein
MIRNTPSRVKSFFIWAINFNLHRMKQHILLLFIIPALLLMSGCDRKSCKEVQCAYNQQCINGECYCLNGYEGSACETESYKKYERSYLVYENCMQSNPTIGQYSCTIYHDPTYINKITINGFLGMGFQLSAYITTDGNNKGNSVTIPDQNLGGLTINGYGTFDEYNNRLTLNVNYTYNFESKSCTHTFYPN